MAVGARLAMVGAALCEYTGDITTIDSVYECGLRGVSTNRTEIGSAEPQKTWTSLKYVTAGGTSSVYILRRRPEYVTIYQAKQRRDDHHSRTRRIEGHHEEQSKSQGQIRSRRSPGKIPIPDNCALF